ncbi:hypothetical protein [Leptospira idonii]|uniref:Uncharacterized protein n=1 Tax=Leptospira idonii TaxID=1193500 RepID=A0A4R9M245_9LEPT|nr:hypothetical protein [Leptospira idonii]TGN20813.1 hypothetical protein EHS15_01890 [Leptospira idonii]
MNTTPFTNTTRDGQVPGVNPDATTDYFLVTDYNQDKNYLHSKIIDALKLISSSPSENFQILYGGIVSDSGDGKIDISEGAAFGKDEDGNFRIIQIPQLTNISLPNDWNDDRQIWVIGKFSAKLGSASRQHFNGTEYIYQLLDSYTGEQNTNDLFVESDPSDTAVVWGSFQMDGSSFTPLTGRSSEWKINSTDSNRKEAIDYSKQIGELFDLDHKKPINFSFDPESPRSYFPAIRLSSIDVEEVISSPTYPSAFIEHLRNQKLEYLSGESGEVSSWSVTVSGSNITFPNSISSIAILTALAEDETIHGTYTNWRTVNINGTDYSITNINLVTRIVTVSGSPASGSQTAIFYPHRIAGSSTTAREFEVSGMTTIAANDPDGYFILGLRTRGFMQGHWHNTYYCNNSTGGALNRMYGSNNYTGATIFDKNEANGEIGSPATDGTNGTPLTRKVTHGPAVSGHKYKWCGGL